MMAYGKRVKRGDLDEFPVSMMLFGVFDTLFCVPLMVLSWAYFGAMIVHPDAAFPGVTTTVVMGLVGLSGFFGFDW